MSKAVHDANVLQYESTRQDSKRSTNTAAGHLAADQAYYTAVLKSGMANGVATGALQALINLGAAIPSLTGPG